MLRVKVNQAGSIVSSIQALRMRDTVISLRFNDAFGDRYRRHLTQFLLARIHSITGSRPARNSAHVGSIRRSGMTAESVSAPNRWYCLEYEIRNPELGRRNSADSP